MTILSFTAMATLSLGGSLGFAQTTELNNSTADALKSYTPEGACDKYYKFRTTDIYLENRTPASIRIAFFRARDTRDGGVPPVFLKDTGVFVGVKNGSPAVIYHSDPCTDGAKRQPVQATEVTGSLNVVYNGKDANIELQKIDTGYDIWLGRAGWTLTIEDLKAYFPDIKTTDQFNSIVRLPGETQAK